jgi:hypothetical protein
MNTLASSPHIATSHYLLRSQSLQEVRKTITAKDFQFCSGYLAYLIPSKASCQYCVLRIVTLSAANGLPASNNGIPGTSIVILSSLLCYISLHSDEKDAAASF